MKYYVTYSEFAEGRLINGTGNAVECFEHDEDALQYVKDNVSDYKSALPDCVVYVDDFEIYFKVWNGIHEYVWSIIGI